jgi:hypothetical protein
LHEDVPSTWEGATAWDPGGAPTGERSLKKKGPVEANKNDATDIDARITTKGTLAASEPVRSGSHQHEMTTHLFSFTLVLFHQELLPLRSDLFFASMPIERAWRRPGEG